MTDERSDEEKYPDRYAHFGYVYHNEDPYGTTESLSVPPVEAAQQYLQEWHTKGYTGRYIPESLTGEDLVNDITRDIYGQDAQFKMNPDNENESQGHVRWETARKRVVEDVESLEARRSSLAAREAEAEVDADYEQGDENWEDLVDFDPWFRSEDEEIYTDPVTGGQKAAKPEMFALVPVWPQEEVARVYGHGSKKYAPNNWRRGYAWSWSLSSLHRHIKKFEKGESFDKGSKLHHLAHATFHLFALMEYERLNLGTDDRPSKENNDE